MKDVKQILSCLEKTPEILSGLLTRIPEDILKTRRIDNSWSIHEHACHVAIGDRIGFLARLHQFLNEESLLFTPLSGESFPEDHFMKLDLEQAIDGFFNDRAELIDKAGSLDEPLWSKEGEHPEYVTYTPHIMLRHLLMHDHLHMYRIEELWLTRDEYLSSI